MSVRNITTLYKYFGTEQKLVLVINDELADLIRGGSSVSRSVTINEPIKEAFFNEISTYVGDISEIDVPLNLGSQSGFPGACDFISSLFNTYSVEGITGITNLTDYFEWSGITANGSSYKATTAAYVNILEGQSGYTPLRSAFNIEVNETTSSSYRYRQFQMTLPILKESDFVDGKIREFQLNEYFSYLGFSLRYYYNNPSISTIGYVSTRTKLDTAAKLDTFNLFANKVIPTPTPPSTDPYGPGPGGPGYSATGGGPNPGGTGTTGTGGLHDDSSDAIPTPSLPSDATISSGLFTAYNPSTSQLASFAQALWNMQVTDINDVLRFLFGGDAFNAVIGLHLLPVAPSTGGSTNIKLGNWDSNVSAPKISSQYKQVPFGSVLLPEYWGNCIDYAPYTKIQLALPYIGIVDVDTDDVLGSTNTLTYNIDVLSGAICATLHCVKFNLSSVIYQWSGACAVSLPFSGASYNSVLGAIAGIAAAGMGFASMAAGPIGAALPAAALAAGGGAFGAGSAASIMGTMKGKVQKSGSFGANSGALGIMTPYFILTRPVQSVPETWQADKGYPSNISAQLGTLTGYTEVSEINLECSGTEAEKNEVIDLLKKGVIF